MSIIIGTENMAILLAGRGANVIENLWNPAKFRIKAPGFVQIDRAADIPMSWTWEDM